MTQPLTYDTARIPAQDETSTEDSVDRYELRRPIKTGGFATVYEGFDPLIKRPVAIKRCGSTDRDTQKRFFREAEIIGKLDHPSIVRLYDFGIENGIPFLVQELLDGVDLADRIDHGPALAVRDKVRVLRQIAEGLGYAHQQGIIHRDVKPSNVRLLEDGTVKLLDFGVAALREAPSNLTRTGTTVGTAAYLAPEQIKGVQPSRTTDMFSFGVVAYELLAEVRPFEGETLSAMLYQIAHSTPLVLHEVEPAVPRVLSDLVHRCLEKDPGARFEDFSAVDTALGDLLENPLLAPPSVDTVPIPIESSVSPGPKALSDLRIDTPLVAQRVSSASIQFRSQRKRSGSRLLPASALLLLLGTGAIAGAWSQNLLPEQLTGILDRGASQVAARVPENWRRSLGLLSKAPTYQPEPTVSERKAPLAELATNSPALEAAAPRKLDRPTLATTTTREVPLTQPTQPAVAAVTNAGGGSPATVFVRPSWDPRVRVAVDNGEFHPLNTRRVLKLDSGKHRFTFALETPAYRTRESVEVELTSGQNLSLESPIAPPAGLTVSVDKFNPDVLVEIDGKRIGGVPTERILLSPGHHEVKLVPVGSDSLEALVKQVDLRTATAHHVSFDFLRRRALVETTGVVDWDSVPSSR